MIKREKYTEFNKGSEANQSKQGLLTFKTIFWRSPLQLFSQFELYKLKTKLGSVDFLDIMYLFAAKS